jgi:death-on-curing protein
VTSYLDLVDFLLIAERVLGVDAKILCKGAGVGLADSALNAPAASFGGVEFYPEFSQKAAVLLEHLVRNHPLPDGNKRSAYACLREFVARNGYQWIPTTSDDAVVTMVRVATGEIALDELVDWISSHLRREA